MSPDDVTRRPPPCPSPELLGRFVAGDLEPGERERCLDHLGACADCAAEVRAVLPLREWAADAAARLGDRRSPTLHRWMQLAAALLVTVGAGMWWASLAPPALERDPVLRSSEGPAPDGSPGGQRLDTAPELLVAEDPLSLAGGAEVRYRFELVDAGLAPVWSSPWVDRPATDLPPEVRSRMTAGTEWLWRVTVDDGSRREEGPWRELAIAP